MPSNPTRRRWSAFSVRTLLILVAICALMVWVYWSAWPRWRMHREQTEFETGVSRLKVGSTTADGMQLVSGKSDVTTTFTRSASGEQIGRTDYIWPDVIYAIYYTLPSSGNGLKSRWPCLSIEVFRLPIPTDASFAKKVAEHRAQNDPVLYFLTQPTGAYLSDFTKFISGDRTGTPPIAFERIYADPPTVPQSR